MERVEKYIIDAASLEEQGDYEGARRISERGYKKYPENYELAFMIANESYLLKEREKAYFYYLLAVSLCDQNPGDQKIILEVASKADFQNLDGAKARIEIKKLIDGRLNQKEYEKTSRYVNTLVFSDDPFLFQEVNDTFLRYYQIILEITECERKRFGENFTADRMRDLTQFGRLIVLCKFAVRRVWFRVGDEKRILELYRDYELSPEFIVILTKCSVTEKETASVLERMAELFSDAGEVVASEVILRYARWFASNHAGSRALRDPENDVDAGLLVYEIDASHPLPQERGEEDVAFILCASKKEYVNELLLYLQCQRLRKGFRGSVYIVWNSRSMTSGYNLAMRSSSAKYKIYIHQDTFLVDRDYTQKLIDTMEKEDYDLLGLAGCDHVPSDGRWGYSPHSEIHMCLYQDWMLYVMNSVTEEMGVNTLETDIEDGVLLATRQNVPWREDLFHYYHFYDLSQCMEYRKAGYKIGFYNNGEPGVLHEVYTEKGASEKEYLIRYNEDREIFLRVYTK